MNREQQNSPHAATGPAGWAGLHLAGQSTRKTALVVLSAGPHPVRISKVYEKIGSFGTLFSDERLMDILVHEGPFAAVFTDCPLTVPPCVSCQRPVCPGAVHCEDVSVAYMLSVTSRMRRRGARKGRPVNPQSQRLWDVLQMAGDHCIEDTQRTEPSYSANMAPLVARAITLQRRINAVIPGIRLRETSVPLAVQILGGYLGLKAEHTSHYRRFEDGLANRHRIADAMVQAGWIQDPEDHLDVVTGSVETFHAFLAAFVAWLFTAGHTDDRPQDFVTGEGWVHVPSRAPPVRSPGTFFG